MHILSMLRSVPAWVMFRRLPNALLHYQEYVNEALEERICLPCNGSGICIQPMYSTVNVMTDESWKS